VVPKPASPTNRVSPEGEQKRKDFNNSNASSLNSPGEMAVAASPGGREEWG